MEVILHETPAAIGGELADIIVKGLTEANDAGRNYVLGCPGGRSAMPVYESLAAIAGRGLIDCSGLVIAMMDEYLLGEAGALRPPPVSAHYSCRGFGEREIAARINAGLPEARRIRGENIWIPDPSAPESYDDRLAEAGGVDLFLLASGAGDGHIAFNPPGSPRDSGSRVVGLAEQTRRDNLATFPEFRSIDEVPVFGVTVGISTIASLSKSVAMIVWGGGKQEAYRRISRASSYDPDWPATIAVECRSAKLLADRSAAGE